MPYIQPADRDPIDDVVRMLPPLVKPGDLNYAVTMLVERYMEQHGLSYHTINDVIGVLECAKLEFYRRKAAVYEDEKCAKNGDVYKVHKNGKPKPAAPDSE